MNSMNDGKAWLARRRRHERLFKGLCLSAILLAAFFLAALFTNLVAAGASAFVRTEIRLPVDARPGTDGRERVMEALQTLFPEVGADDRQGRRRLGALVSQEAARMAGSLTVETKVELWVPASSELDMLAKGRMSRENWAENRRFGPSALAQADRLEKEGRLRKSFNTRFFTHGDSRNPEGAGVMASVMGSVFTILICMAVAIPLGVATAVYLSEFARPGWFTSFIEVNINNLAAVPSVVYGLLGLSVYLNLFGLPRSSSLVGGLTLAMLVLPVVVLATRNALKAVPRSIRFAVMALGASKVQMTFHHIVPYALPGIMTGIILGVARALGETAPLLMIGMVAFVADVPETPLDPATTLPVQIYLWANNPEIGFVEKTAAAILVLLAFMTLVNMAAIYVRRRYEIKW